MKCTNPITIGKEKGKGIHVACGRCMPCQKNRRRDWSFRLQEEQHVSTNSCFITLTYEEENIPVRDSFPTLLKTDVQAFISKLRKYQDRYWEKHFKENKTKAYTNEWIKSRYKIRYYAVGEYGKRGDRPHYHIILFNVAPKLINELSTIWGKGFAHIGEVNNKSIKYCTKYIIGKEGPGLDRALARKPKEGPGKAKCFSLKSTNPGIGHSYLTREIIEYHQKKYAQAVAEVAKGNDVWNIPLVRSREGYFQRMPDYYKNKIFDSEAGAFFKEQMIKIGDKITNEDWEEAYKKYGELADYRLQEKFENLNKQLIKRIKSKESL